MNFVTKLFSFLFFLTLLGAFAFLALLVPTLNKLNTCYVTTAQNMQLKQQDEAVVQRPQKQICSDSFDELSAEKACIGSVMQNSFFTKPNPIKVFTRVDLEEIIKIFDKNLVSFDAQSQKHNNLCQDYSDLLIQ